MHDPALPRNTSGLTEQPHVALLIDWENIKASTTNLLGGPPDIITLKKIARRYGDLSLARAYANWADQWHEGDIERLLQQGIEPVFVMTRRYRDDGGGEIVKNSADIRLACDGVEMVRTNPELTCFIIVSGDGALVHVISKLLAHGKQVVSVAVEGAASAALRTLNHKLVLYDEWIKGVLFSSGDQRVKDALKQFQHTVEDLCEGKMDTTLTSVKASMRKQIPDFEEEEMGIASFRHLAYLAEAKGLVRIDGSAEPAVAYRKSDTMTLAGRLLHEGPKWTSFIKALDPSTMYQKAALLKVVKEKGIHQEDLQIHSLVDNACRSGVLWPISSKYCDVKTMETQVGTRFKLNLHNPRVQVVTMSKPKKT